MKRILHYPVLVLMAILITLAVFACLVAFFFNVVFFLFMLPVHLYQGTMKYRYTGGTCIKRTPSNWLSKLFRHEMAADRIWLVVESEFLRKNHQWN